MEKPIAHLIEWESSLQRELRSLQKSRESLEIEIQQVTKKLELIRQMRSLEESPDNRVATIPPPTAEARATPILVKDAVKRILSDSPRPLHIGEIHREFLTRALPIPGSGTPFNILAHVVNDKAFVRVARGTYALAGTVADDQVLPKAQRGERKRRRRKRKARQKEQNQNGIEARL